jgi:predicted pyridoxine 5'-phosphate oxidase superfamily flavin-nucleotide-binding protein
VSWPFLNLEITIALLWYDPKQIEKAGYTSLFQLITLQSDPLSSLLYPAGLALLYTVLIRNVLNAIQTWTTSWGDRLNIWLSKNGSIPMEKFLNLREIYKKETLELEKVIKDESKTIENYEEERTKRLSADQKVIELQNQKTDLDTYIYNLFNVSFLNGNWSVTSQADGTPKQTEHIEIQNGEIFQVDGRSKNHAYRIGNYMYDTRRKNLFFVKHRVSNGAVRIIKRLEKDGRQYVEEEKISQFLINDLIVQDKNTISGSENSISVKYKRTDEI